MVGGTTEVPLQPGCGVGNGHRAVIISKIAVFFSCLSPTCLFAGFIVVYFIYKKVDPWWPIFGGIKQAANVR